MEKRSRTLKTPRAVGVACAIAATGLGMVYMAAAGAPALYLGVNALALALGLAVFAAAGRARGLSGWAMLGGGALLLATALFGMSVEGASRWIRIAGLSVQVSLVVVPAMLVVFARRADLLSTAGVMTVAAALALQPDRGMAGVLVLALASLALLRRDPRTIAALGVATTAFAVTLLRPDALPAVPYVDRVLYTAFGVHALAGLAVVGGALLLVVPAVVGLRLDPRNREVHATFGAVWLGVVAAAALGDYPTPLVGYGGSAVLGYLFSLIFLPPHPQSAAEALAGPAASDAADHGSPLRTGLAFG